LPPATPLACCTNAAVWSTKCLRTLERACLAASLALIAVGGYGRGELYPASDVDLLILLPEQADDVLTARTRTTGLPALGHRTGNRPQRAHLEQCLEEAAGDITVQTAMIEARLLPAVAACFRAFVRSSGQS
jgi:[protein-PII] uridylyltransferase